MRKFTLLGALAFFCVTVAQADISDWGSDKIVKPSELQTGGSLCSAVLPLTSAGSPI